MKKTMSAEMIYDLVPLGSTLRYSDGTPRPPERHRKKLAAWENRSSGGRLVRKQAESRIGNTTILPTSPCTRAITAVRARSSCVSTGHSR